MNKTKKPRVIQVVKAIGPTSSPWTNFYPSLRPSFPGLMLPPLQVNLTGLNASFKWQQCRSQQRKYLSLGILNGVCLLRRLSLRGSRPLVVHVHTPVLAIVPILALLIGAKFKVVNTQQNTWPNFRPHQKLALWCLSWVTRAYIGCAEQATASLPEKMSNRLAKTGKLHAIPNGIPSEQLAEFAERKQQSIQLREVSEQAQTIVIAKMSSQKNGLYLLQLINQLPELGHVTWYGRGKMRDELHAELGRLGLQDRVTFAGVVPREQIYNALARSDFYLTVSLWEGLSVADLEAVAIGCFPLMSNIPERHVIADRAGFDLLPLANISAWRQRINEYSVLGQAAKLKVISRLSENTRNQFSIERMIASYVDVYKKVAKA